MGLSAAEVGGMMAGFAVIIIVIIVVLIYTKSKPKESEHEETREAGAETQARKRSLGGNEPYGVQQSQGEKPTAEAQLAESGTRPSTLSRAALSGRTDPASGSPFRDAVQGRAYDGRGSPTEERGRVAPPPTPDHTPKDVPPIQKRESPRGQSRNRLSPRGGPGPSETPARAETPSAFTDDRSWDDVSQVPLDAEDEVGLDITQFAASSAHTVAVLAAAVSYFATDATLDEEIRILEEELAYQKDVLADTDHVTVLQEHLRVRQEIKSLGLDLPDKQVDLKDAQTALKDEHSGQGQVRAKKDLEKAQRELKEHVQARAKCQGEVSRISKKLEFDIPMENARLQSDLEATQGSIRVIARVRPGAGGKDQGTDECLEIQENSIAIKSTPEKYQYDVVFWTEANQADVFSEVRSHVADVFRGKNAVIFAYGQTGSGKTHTLVGSEAMPGVARRMMSEVFNYRHKVMGPLVAHRWPVRCSMIELYIDDFCDLLRSGEKLAKTGGEAPLLPQVSSAKEKRLKELSDALLRCVDEGVMAAYFAKLHKYGKDRIKKRAEETAKPTPKRGVPTSARAGSPPASARSALMQDDTPERPLLKAAMMGSFKMQNLATKQQLLWQPIEMPAEDEKGLQDLFARGDKARHVRSTDMNAASSRSHLIFTIIVRSPDGQEGRIALIDLAGSERLTRSKVEGQGKQEAIAINKSLTALGNVIEKLSLIDSAKGDGKILVPYREHALTQMLQPWLTGSSKVTMFMNVSPLTSNKHETSSTLRFAQRAKAAKLQDEGKAGPLRREIRKLQKLEKEAQDEMWKLNEMMPHLEHQVERAEEHEVFCLDQVRNAAQRKKKLESRVERLAQEEKEMKHRFDRLTKATRRPKRYVTEADTPVPYLTFDILKKAGDHKLCQVDRDGQAGRTWDPSSSFMLSGSMRAGLTPRGGVDT
eukprot:Hpha_TRINITY_DN15821_c4_g3::TRINITY_DN15821_c4_g3_i1::g.188605::m.188605